MKNKKSNLFQIKKEEIRIDKYSIQYLYRYRSVIAYNYLRLIKQMLTKLTLKKPNN